MRKCSLVQRIGQNQTERIGRNMIGVNNLRNNCIYASIIHALMLVRYPELDYEQSWDDNNYSIVCNGARVTFSFRKADFCVIAFRCNEYSIVDNCKLKENFSEELYDFAMSEALQYLLENKNGYIKPCISGMICLYNSKLIQYPSNSISQLYSSVLLVKCLFDSYDSVAKYLSEYYEMDKRQMEYAYHIYKEFVSQNGARMFVRACELKNMIGGDDIDLCIDSLAEIGIFVVN